MIRKTLVLQTMEGRLFPSKEEEEERHAKFVEEKNSLIKKVLSLNQTCGERAHEKLKQINASYEQQELNQMRADISALKQAANAAQVERAELCAEIQELKKLLQK